MEAVQYERGSDVGDICGIRKGDFVCGGVERNVSGVLGGMLLEMRRRGIVDPACVAISVKTNESKYSQSRLVSTVPRECYGNGTTLTSLQTTHTTTHPTTAGTSPTNPYHHEKRRFPSL